MIFNTYIFLLAFLPICAAGYYVCRRRWGQVRANYFLLLCSGVFYAYYSIPYMLWLLFDCLVNYYLTDRIYKTVSKKAKKGFLVVGICLNIGALLGFRYYNYFADYIQQSWSVDPIRLIIVPLGISFITFSQIAYLVNAYQNKNKAASLQEYFLYILFFPKVSSGPIVLPEDFLGQIDFHEKKEVNYDNIIQGIYLFVLGLTKKVLVADSLAQLVNWGWENIAILNASTALVVTICYSLQIYFDFSGYSDMALGIARIFEIRLPWNFRSPYKATSISDFWDRWHITLTKFFTTYLYIPLGGSRKGVCRTYINIMIIFLASGFWHGSTINFIIWGGLHGVAMVLHRLIKAWWNKLPKFLAMAATGVFINFTWIFFRAETLESAKQMIKIIFWGDAGRIRPGFIEVFNELEEITVLNRLGLSMFTEQLPYIAVIVLLLVLICIVVFAANTEERLEKFNPTLGNMVLTSILLVWCTISFSGVTAFVYSYF